MDEIKPKTGERWYVKMQGARCLTTQTVVDITPLTVELDDEKTAYPNTTRYERSDIKFVEKVN